MGGEAAARLGDPRVLAQGPTRLDVPPADLRLTGHRKAAAAGGEEVPGHRQRLAADHEQGAQGPELSRLLQHGGPARALDSGGPRPRSRAELS